MQRRLDGLEILNANLSSQIVYLLFFIHGRRAFYRGIKRDIYHTCPFLAVAHNHSRRVEYQELVNSQIEILTEFCATYFFFFFFLISATSLI